MRGSRAAFIVFSLVVHGAFAFGIGELRVSKSHAATAIQFAEAKKPAKKLPPAKVEPPPRKPEPPARERRASAPKPAEAPPPPDNTPPPAAPVSDLPDFGLSLTGGVDGTGIALPAGGSAHGGPRQPQAPKSGPRKLLPVAAATSGLDPCEEPPAKPKLHSGSIPQPAGTEAARAAGVAGKVRVQLTVDEAGHVVDVKLLQGLGYGLDEQARAAAGQGQFDPAVRCGKPTRSTFNVSMTFTL